MRKIEDEDLLSMRPRRFLLELTSRCNLRCVYCAVSHPDYQGRDLELDPMGLIESLERLRPEEVQLSGHGETTILPGWCDLVRRMLERGVPVCLTTNLCKRFNDEEFEVLSRLRRITVSCDTADPEQYGALRRGGTFSRLERNLRRLTAQRNEFGTGPGVVINCVLNAQTYQGLSRLVAWAAEQGVNGVATVDYIEYDHGAALVPESLDGIPVGEVAARVEEARALAGEMGLRFTTMGGLGEWLKEMR